MEATDLPVPVDVDAIVRAMTNAPRRRPTGSCMTFVPAAYQAGPGLWVIVFYSQSPKNGWEHRLFPMYWCQPGKWRAPGRDGDVPDGTLVWATADDAHADLCDSYPPDQRFTPGWCDFPSFDQRRRTRT